MGIKCIGKPNKTHPASAPSVDRLCIGHYFLNNLVQMFTQYLYCIRYKSSNDDARYAEGCLRVICKYYAILCHNDRA